MKPRREIIPKRGQGDAGERAATFKAEATRAQATPRRGRRVRRRPRRSRPLSARKQSARDVAHGRGRPPERDALGATALELSRGASDGHDHNAVSAAFAAVAETGTLALVSGPANPTTLNFLPDNHVVIVFADDLVGDYESVFAKLRAAYGAGAAPRTLNFITGPSRSADIEQTLLLGAHGPRRLHVVVVGASPEAGAAK